METRRLVNSGGTYGTAYQAFKTWLLGTKAATDTTLIQDGGLRFTVGSADRLKPWLQRWRGGRASPVDAVRCFFASLNAHNYQAMTKCYATSALTVRNGARTPVNFDASRGYREFEAATQARFSFDLKSASDSTADVVLHEESDFLRALGLAEVTADWRYVVRGSVIVEEHHLRADSAYAARFREFVGWGRGGQTALWSSVLDANGNVQFNGTTGRALVALGQQWSLSRRSPP